MYISHRVNVEYMYVGDRYQFNNAFGCCNIDWCVFTTVLIAIGVVNQTLKRHKINGIIL